VSVIIAGIISTCLLLHYVFAYMHDDDADTKLQITGRKFMLSITGLFVLIGFQALAFSRLEGWKYFDGIYFSTQTTLTVGYGDLVPTTTWSKILCFPFAVLTIAQLANEVSIIIDFLKDRATDRRDKWRKRYSIAMHRAALQVKPYGTLIDEICLIHQIELHQQRWVVDHSPG
jgi:potassium channel subfamily K